jgi:anti-sigma factor RsiW
MLQRYIDQELDEKARVRASRHIEGCQRCGTELEIYSRIKDALAGIPGRDDPHPEDGPAAERLRRFAENLNASVPL